MSKAKIQKLIDTAPSSWLKMFKRYKLGRKPTVDQLIETVLEYTPTMRSSGQRGKARHKVPNAVKKEAMDGLVLAHKHNWTSASGVGLVRAMQLVVRPKIWDRSVNRMNNYFTRHVNDKDSNAIRTGKETWGPRKPSRGYIAHLAWGGDSGQNWASKQVMKTNPKVSKRTLTNPKGKPTKRLLVPKEHVWMEGFSKAKTKAVEKEIPFVLGFIEEMRGQPLRFPTPIRAMTKREFRHGRTIVDNGHPMGAGHGQIDLSTNDIAINPTMGVKDLVANVFHENLHYAFPEWSEEDVRDMTGKAMLNLYGEYILGRPFAEERKSNPKRRQNPTKILGSIDGQPIQAIIRDELPLGMDITLQKDGKTIGLMISEIHPNNMDSPCEVEINKLKRRLGLSKPYLVTVESDIFNPTDRGLGFGKAMYMLMIEQLYQGLNYPFMFMPDVCKGSSTSNMAKRVWESLAKQFPNELHQDWYGRYYPVIAITKPVPFEPVHATFADQKRNPKRRHNRGVSTKDRKDRKDRKGRKIPAKYLTGYKGKKLRERIAEISKRRDEYQQAIKKYGDKSNFTQEVFRKLFRPFKTDEGIKSKSSKYTVEAKKRGFTGSVDEKAQKASQYYGGYIDPMILDEVNARGKTAWVSGGHRPGQTPFSWGIARVNSFLVGGKTFWTADADLARMLPSEVYLAIVEQNVTYPIMGIISLDED